MSHTSLFNEKPTRSLSEFEFLQDPKDKNSRLGIGSFATVKLARERNNNNLIALKIANLETSKSKAADLHNLRTEIRIHKRIDHPNIIKYLGYTQERYCIYIALDYAEKGNLYTYIHKNKTSLSPEEIFRFFYQTCLAIQYLHRHDVMHRDIKPENLLLDKDLNIKLCDFGWAAERVKDKRTTFCGTYEYMAPEIVHKRPYDYRIDIWSLGILLYELIHGEAPYKGRSLSEIWNSLSKSAITYSSSIDPQARDLIEGILRLNPNDRLSIQQILSHPWVKQNLPADSKDTHSSAHTESKHNKTNRTTNKENLNDGLLTSSASERPMTSATHINTKLRKQSSCQPLQGEGVRNRHVEEQSSESSGRTQTKSSSSLARTILESIDAEEKKGPNNFQKKKETVSAKDISPHLQKSLQSVVNPSTRIMSPDYLLNEVIVSTNPAASNISNALENFSIRGNFNKNTESRHIKLNKSMTPTSLLTSHAVTSNLRSEFTSNCHTPASQDDIHAFEPSKKTKTIINSHDPTSSRLLLTSIVPHASDGAFAQTPNHQKTLRVINGPSQSRKTPIEDYKSASSTRIIYKGNKYLISPRTPVSGYESLKNISQDLDGFTSPIGWIGDTISKPVTEVLKSEENKRKEGGLKSFENFENLMNMRPQTSTEMKINNGRNGNLGIYFNEFVQGNQSKQKIILDTKENRIGVRISGAIKKRV